MVRLLDGMEVNYQVRELVETMRLAAEGLLVIVNDLLDLSKIEAGELSMETLGFRMGDLMTQVVNPLMPLARQKGLVMTDNRSDLAQWPVLLGDPQRLRQVLTNLVSNAIKYTDKGEVDVRVDMALMDGVARVQMEVRDTGIGIPVEKQQLIFQKFVQADSSITRRYGGTGLGLAICRELVERMGGALTLKSVAGKGSAFRVELMLPVTDESALPDESAARRMTRERKAGCYGALPVTGARVLVAEDHPLNQVYIRKLMDGFGIEAYTLVDDGRKALDALEAGAYDLLLLDCHMPEMGGYEVAARVRQMEAADPGRGHLPIVAVTANAMAGEEQKCLAAGMDDYVPKPIEPAELYAVLSQWLVLPPNPFAHAAAPEPRKDGAPCDLSQMLEFCGDDVAAQGEMIGIFLDQSRDGMAELARCLQDGDVDGWVAAAHKLKGGAGGVGAERLRVAAAEAQGMADEGEADARVAQLEILDAAFAEAETWLVGYRERLGP